MRKYEIRSGISLRTELFDDKIFEYTSNINYVAFNNNTLIQDAVIRRFDIISYACFKLSNELKYKIDFIPWDRIIDIRSKLLIDDFNVNAVKVWEIVNEDLPILKDNITKVIDELNQNI